MAHPSDLRGLGVPARRGKSKRGVGLSRRRGGRATGPTAHGRFAYKISHSSNNIAYQGKLTRHFPNIIAQLSK
jgi:hypothetical protein